MSIRTEVSTAGGTRSGHPSRWDKRGNLKNIARKQRRADGKAAIRNANREG